jgi:hypothetical protein
MLSSGMISQIQNHDITRIIEYDINVSSCYVHATVTGSVSESVSAPAAGSALDRPGPRAASHGVTVTVPAGTPTLRGTQSQAPGGCGLDSTCQHLESRPTG